MSAIDELVALSDAFGFDPDAERIFLAACRESFEHHYEHNEVFRGFAARSRICAADIQSAEDLPRLPYVLVTVMKQHRLLSVPVGEITSTFTSSGTTGQSSHCDFDEISSRRHLEIRRHIFETYGLVSEEPVNCLVFSYDEASSGQKGAASTHRAYAKFAPPVDTFCALRAGPSGETVFDAHECVAVLDRYSASGLPVRITGFPVFLWRTLQELECLEKRYGFPKESLIINGGGWKNRCERRDIEKPLCEKDRGTPRDRA